MTLEERTSCLIGRPGIPTILGDPEKETIAEFHNRDPFGKFGPAPRDWDAFWARSKPWREEKAMQTFVFHSFSFASLVNARTVLADEVNDGIPIQLTAVAVGIDPKQVEPLRTWCRDYVGKENFDWDFADGHIGVLKGHERRRCMIYFREPTSANVFSLVHRGEDFDHFEVLDLSGNAAA